MPATKRWTLHDPRTNATWEFPRNPNAMTSPHGPRNTVIFSRSPVTSGGAAGVSRVLQYRQQPYEWSFSGDIRGAEHWATFLAWTRKLGRLHVTDHLGRTWEIRIDSTDLDEERPRARQSHRFTYTVKAVIYGRVS